MIAWKRDKLSAPSRPAQFVSSNFPQLWQSCSENVFFIFSLFLFLPLLSFSLSLSPSLFCALPCSSGKRARDEEGGKGTRALLINYSVGVAPLKIKIGSLSGATWNFFLNWREEGAGSDDGYRFSTFVMEGRATSDKTVDEARGFDSLVCSDRQSVYSPFGLNGPDEAATLFIPARNKCLVNDRAREE